MEYENLKGINFTTILVITWVIVSTTAYLYQFNHLFDKIWKLLMSLVGIT